MRNWRDWFIEPDDEEATATSEAQIRIEAGSGHLDEPLRLKRKTPPRCARCKRWMGYNDGMYIMITTDWRVHIKCFNEVIERHYENGEVIDLTTGTIVKLEEDNG